MDTRLQGSTLERTALMFHVTHSILLQNPDPGEELLLVLCDPSLNPLVAFSFWHLIVLSEDNTDGVTLQVD